MKALVAAIPAGTAVAAFAAVPWPSDLAVVAALLALLALLSRLRDGPGFRELLLVGGFVFAALLASTGLLLGVASAQSWLPLPATGALAGLAVVLGLLAIRS